MQREIEDELKKRLKNHKLARMMVDIEDADVPELSNAADHIRGEFLELVDEEIDKSGNEIQIA